MSFSLSPTTFQYFSDVHSELYEPNNIATFDDQIQMCAPYLLLAGDIGDPFSQSYYDFIRVVSSKGYKHILIVSGNHEYYGYDDGRGHWMERTDDKIRNVVRHFPNVSFLQNNMIDIPGTDLTVFGGTFWTRVSTEEENNARKYLKDYREIPHFSLEKAHELHNDSCLQLQRAINDRPHKRFIVMSHHLPSSDLIDPIYIDKQPAINSTYACDIEIAKSDMIVAWIAGHTHTPVQKGKFYVNPIGYPGENSVIDFNKTFSITYQAQR